MALRLASTVLSAEMQTDSLRCGRAPSATNSRICRASIQRRTRCHPARLIG